MDIVKKTYLLLEQLEERIFLDANPLAAAGGDVAVDGVDPLASGADLEPDADSAADSAPSDSEPARETESDSQDEVDASAREQGEDDPDASSTTAESAGETDTAPDNQGDDGTEAPTEAAAEADAAVDDLEATDQPGESDPATIAQDEPADPEDAATESQTAIDDESSVASSDTADESLTEDDPTSTTETQADTLETGQAENSGSVEDAMTPIDPMIGEEFTFTVTLDNTTTETLYGPYIDLYMPTAGDDGDGDGVSFRDATYLGTPVNATVQTFDLNGEIEHPFAVDGTGAPITISGTQGDTYVTLEMPFGSFTPDQPAAEIEITAFIDQNRAVDEGGGAAQDFDIEVYNGYRFGSDPLDNPATDTPDPPALVDTQTFRPEVIRFEKTYIGPEQETVSGPNYPRQYQITVDVAAGQTITNLTLTENLPNEIFYLGNDTVRVNGGTTGFTATSPNAAGNGDGIFTDGDLTIALTSPVTGSTTSDDPEVIITFDFYVPQFYADGSTPILDPDTGDDAIGGTEDREVVNDVQIQGDWDPTDEDDAEVTIVMDAEVDGAGNISPTPSIDEILDAEAIAIQKGVGIAFDTGVAPDADGEGGYNPGDIVQFTLEFQISDYFNFGDIVINDLLPDGLQLYSSSDPGASDYLAYDAAYVPTFSIQDETVSNPWSGTWSVGTNLITDENPGSENNLALTFNVSDVAGGADGILQGDLFDDTTSGSPAMGTITYYALIKDEYLSSGGSDSSGPGDVSVDQGDVFNNSVTIEGQIYGDDGAGGLTDAGFGLDQDSSAAGFQIEVGGVQKEIYAINGSTDLSAYEDASGNLHLEPGFTVTYRLQYSMPTSEFETFQMTDYLPLPVLEAGEITSASDVTIGGVTQSITPPPAGSWYFHTDDTFADNFGAEPIDVVINNAGGENSISFVYDEHDDVAPQETTIDILFTVTVTNDPFADGIFLTNQVRGTEDGTPLVNSDTDAIVQVVLDQPVLDITKGVVETDNDVVDGTTPTFSQNADVDDYFTEPGGAGSRLDGVTISSAWLAGNDIDTDLTGIDAGDTVTFAVVVENTGHFDAYDVVISDDLPNGFITPATAGDMNFAITTGSGALLTAGSDYTFTLGANSFSLELADTAMDGAIEGLSTANPEDDNTGDNVIIITYDLVAAASVAPLQQISNTATLEQYTNYDEADPADNHIPAGVSDDATVSIAEPIIEKVLVGTSIDNGINENTEAVIGETLQYRVTITVPEGETPDLRILDSLDPGLALVSIDSITLSAGLTAANAFATPVTSPGGDISYTENVGGSDSLAINFGTVSNSTDSNDTSETITIEYTALVLNTTGNQSTISEGGPNLNNAVQAEWQSNGSTQTASQDAPTATVSVIEPALEINKSVTVEGATDPDQVSGDEGDTMSYTIVIQHAGNSETDAFDVSLEDSLPAEIVSPTIANVTDSAGILTGADFFLDGGSVLRLDPSSANVTADGTIDIPYDSGRVITVVISGTLATTLNVGDLIENDANLDWSSLSGDTAGNIDISGFVTTGDVERDGSGGVNNYTDSDPADILIGLNSVDKILVNSELSTEPDAPPTSNLVAPNDADGINNGREAVIGETLTYQLTITLAEGDSPDFHLLDTLDPGLSLVSIDSLELSSPDISGTNIPDLQAAVAGALSIDDPSDSSFVTYTHNSGGNDTLDINFGDVVNSNSLNTVAETITFTYTAMVTDVPGNTGAGSNAPGTQLDNAAQVQWDNTNGDPVTSDPDSADSIEVIEPELNIVKDVNVAGSGDAGDTVTYTITVAHAGTSEADAYDIQLDDVFDTQLTSLQIDSALIGGSDVAGALELSGTTLSTTGDLDLLFGQQLVLTISGILAQSVQPGEEIENTADLTWTSMDGDQTDRSGFVDNGEDQERATAASDDADFTTPSPTIDKLGGGSYTIGDSVVYDIVVTVPEGTINNLTVLDQLPDGLIYDSYTVDQASAFSGTLNLMAFASDAEDGNDLLFEFDPIIALSSPDGTADNAFIITVNAIVANIGPNVDGGTLENTATLSYDDGEGVRQDITDDPVSVDIDEPWVATTKTVADTDTDPTTTIAEPGETLTYTVTLSNGSPVTAFETIALDDLPDGVEYNLGSAQVTSSTNVANAGAAMDVTYDDIANTLRLSNGEDGWDIGAGGSLTLEYTVTVMSAGFTAGTYTNTVEADWSSQDGTANSQERNYDEDDGIDSPVDDGLNADRDLDDAQFVVNTDGSIGDTVWFDSNANGTQAGDATEPGISDVWVHLTADVDNDGFFELDRWTQTDADGSYLFDDLPIFDDYTVTVDYNGDYADANGGFDLEAAGYGPTADPDGIGPGSENIARTISITAAQLDIDTIDFGYAGTQSIGDLVWYDGDGDGDQPDTDTNENGLGGIEVTLTADIDGDGTAEYTDTTLTAADGSYQFDNLPAGDYTVAITLPSAQDIVTYDQDDTTTNPDGSTDFTLPATGGDRDDLDFGIRGTGSIGDTVWFDADADGIQDGGTAEPGISGVAVTLEGDADSDGIIDYTLTTVTDADGNYLFDNLLGGTYTVSVDYDGTDSSSLFDLEAAGYSQTFDRDEDGSPILDNTASGIELDPGENQEDVDFGYTGTGSIGDRVWYDLDSDGVQDSGEAGLSNVAVTITADIDGDGVNEYNETVLTGADGIYLFDNLPSAEYTISVDTATLPGGAVPTYDLDSGTTSPDNTDIYTLGAGEATDRVDFGYTGPGSIGDTVWNDIDGDGQQSSGEAGFAGVTVTLTGDLNNDGDTTDPEDTLTTTTDADGNYSFDGLFLGDYTVSVDPASLPPGNSPTYDLDDPTGAPFLTLDTTDVSLTALAPNREDVDFGYNSQGTIGDTVWYDLNADGFQDPEEFGLAGVTVTLNGDLNNDGDTTDPEDTLTTTTDDSGSYLFDQLAAGDYTITVDPATLPGGMVQTGDPDGTNDNSSSLTLGSGETNLDQDFGYTGTGTIGDTIWSDVDGDGTDNGGTEAGFPGVTVTLTGDLNNDGDTTDPEDTLTTTTAADGTYSFDNLAAGDYTIVVDETTLPPGVVQTGDPDSTLDSSSDITLAPGEANLDQDFGYQQTGTIGDTVWYDLNADGFQDPEEFGLAGVTVTLNGDLNNDGDTTDPEDTLTTTTDDSGSYLFDQLAAGDYTITVDPATLPGGMVQTGDPDGTNDNSSSLTLGSGETNLDQDFGYTGTGTIGDTIWSDVDGDGTDNGGTEAGFPGVTVTLTGDLNNDGDTTDPEDTLTTTTAADGTYSFDNLAAGDYTIVVDETTLPPGVVQTGDPDSTLDSSSDITLAPGEANLDQDFGYQQTGTIGDTVWYDLNADGIQDPDELGLANVNVTLIGNLDDDPELETLVTVTDSDGNYLFDELPAGDYSIIVDPDTLPDGMLPTFDLDGTGSANTASVSLGDNEANLDVDFGYTGTGTIGDTIWYDFDGDGVEDPDEAGIPGITVTLTGDLDNDGIADDILTVTTDENGTYSFPNLPAGDFTIAVDPTDLPGGMIPTGDPDGALDNTTLVPLAAGETNLDQDFGYTGTGSVGDQLWNDIDGDGVQDPGEPGLPGVEITIGVDLDGDGTPDFTTSTTTDASGGYIFDNLPAGSHGVSVDPATLPPGIRPSFDPDGTLDNTFQVNLGPGETIDSVDFGYRYPPPPVTPPPVIPPPLTVTPPVPPVPPVPPMPTEPVEPAGLVADAFFMHRQFGDTLDVEFPWDRDLEIRYPLPPLPVSPVYTGMAEPGTTLFLTIYDHTGDEVGYQTVMADTAGNWLANFPATLLFDMPHHMAIEQTASSYNNSSPGLFNTRTYFNPNFSGMIFARNTLDVDAVFAYLPSTVMNSMHESNHSLLNLEWNDFKGYEFFAPSINPAKLGH